MPKDLLTFLQKETTNLEHAGLFKSEVAMDEQKVVDLATNDYLGLSRHPAVKEAARAMIEAHGSGLGSARMITGTRTIHSELERAISRYLGTEETLLFSSRYHANTGLFESLFDDRDFLFSDEHAHPSLADGMRLSKARIVPYHSGDLDHLEDRLKRSRAARFRAIVTDGIFPLEGRAADLAAICALGERYDALVFVDDSQGLGVMGRHGRGTPEAVGAAGDVDLVTGTLTHAIGAGSGGFASGRKELIAWLRQKSRPYLVSSAPPPASVGAALSALGLMTKDLAPLELLRTKVGFVRKGLTERGFTVFDGEHPIVMLMIGQALAAQRAANTLYQRGVYVVGFCHPVVPEGAARLRLQISVRHGERELESVLTAFEAVKRELDRAK